jgi:proline racemase/trans-L-3-hydroxyproline dehydratase
VREVSFDNTPVFAYQLDARLSVPDLGDVLADIVYSGGFFALVKAQRTGLELVPANVEALINLGIRIRDAAQSQLSVRHPTQPFTELIDCVEFSGPAERQADGALHARNTVILGNRTVDRSPCGTGTCARMAVLHARGELKLGEGFVSESIIGTRFIGRIVGETKVGEFNAILPRVSGRAHLTGLHQFVLDPEDPFPHGFFLTDSETKE